MAERFIPSWYELPVSDWFEIIVPAAPASAEEVGALLAAEVTAAQSGTELRSDCVVFWVLAEEAEFALAEARRVARSLADAGFAVSPEGVRAQPALPEEEWREAWKKYFHVTHLTRQIVIVPSWETYDDPRPDDLIVHLDPGQAFGTGLHSTTRMLMEELQELSDRGKEVARFLDVGTGSGILSIAAAKLWQESHGHAVDTDPIAVAAAIENCEKNQVAGRVESSDRPVADIGGTFDLVMANIQADVLEALCAEISQRVAPGGVLLLSGLLDEQVEGVAERYATHCDLVIEAFRAAVDESGFRSARLSRVREGA